MANNKFNLKQWVLDHKLLCTLVLLALVIIFPFTQSSGLPVRIVTTIMIYCLLSMGNMIISGYTGMLNMGQAAFYGVGGYISALLSVEAGLPFWMCLLLAGIGSGLCGFLLSFLCLRVETDFLSLITIAFANVFVAIINNWVSVTKGPMGVPSIQPAKLFGIEFNTPVKSYFLLLSVVLIVYVIFNNVIKAKTGRAFQATRDDEIGARSVGVNVNRQKVLAFTMGTITAGLAGSLMVHYIGFVGPSNFTFDESLLVMQMCIIGGLGSMPGAILGAAFMTILPEIFRPLATIRLGVGGFILILCMLFRPQGILGSRAFAGDRGFQDRIKAMIQSRRLSKEKQSQEGGN